MEPPKLPPQMSLFQVYLRLRPALTQLPKPQSDQWLLLEPPSTSTTEAAQDSVKASFSTHITLHPPNDSRKRAIERFGFTKIFPEEAAQLDIFEETGTADTIKSLLSTGRDGLIATLGVTGSGKSHTILGSKSQRGLTQMTLDVIFRSIGRNIRRPDHPDLPTDHNLLRSLQASDPSEAQILPATSFLEAIYGEGEKGRSSRAQTPMVTGGSRAQTPMMVWHPTCNIPGSFPASPPAHGRPPQAPYPEIFLDGRESQLNYSSNRAKGLASKAFRLRTIPELPSPIQASNSPSKAPFWNRSSFLIKRCTKSHNLKDSAATHAANRRNPPPRPSALPLTPDVSSYAVEVTPDSDFVVLVSMYEVYNDRIFDLLSHPATSTSNVPMATRAGAALQKGLMRRPLLFKNTEMSLDRKVVSGLRKVLCGSYDEAMMVLETGLIERRVAGTGSNSVSSRSHGFFCIEVKQRLTNQKYSCYGAADWNGGTLSIVDLAGSERARNAKTTGSTLAEAGKINESLMYLGQCLQVQSDCHQDGSRPIVPFRQCKLTELLFSNSFPSKEKEAAAHRNPQTAIMIVTADPKGDFNATSQILRYSALAREVTVPRVPSVTSTILGNAARGAGGRLTPTSMARYESQFSVEELELAANEVARVSEEADVLAVRLAEAEIRITEEEFKRQAAEERAAAIEQEVREECWAEMEARISEEKERWKRARDEESLCREEFLDEKIGVLEKNTSGTFEIHEDEQSRVEELEREIEALRARLQAIERDRLQRSPTQSPTKKSKAPSRSNTNALVLSESANTNVLTNPFLASLRPKNGSSSPTGSSIDVQDISPRKLSLRPSTLAKIAASSGKEDADLDEENEEPKTPATVCKKKQRKLTTRKWDLGNPEELDF